MEIVYKKINELKPYENNSRTHDESQIKQICESIKEYGWTNPVLIDEKGMIIAGHGRVEAGKKLDIKEVPCIVLSGLTEAQKKAYVIADNKMALNAGWNEELLKTELENLKELDFDLELTGFNIDELDDLLNDKDEEKEVVEDDFEVEVPEEPKAKLGDIYQLGNHRLMCGDSFNNEDREKLINDVDIDMVMTDPPYDMEMGGQGCFAEGMKNCKKRLEDIIHFNPYQLEFLKDLNSKSYYIFTSKNGVPKYLEMFKEMNFNILIWAKTNCPPFTSGTFLPDIEYLLFFSKQGEKIWNNSLKPTETYKKYYVTPSKIGKIEAGTDEHPTIKPQQILQDKIRISSNKNGYVLDLFGGSGSTLIACEQTNRKCLMMEYSPKYVDVIIKRWEEFTGKKAMLIKKRRIKNDRKSKS